ncbi:MAG: chaperonin GroES [Actinomycetota bacterium]|jgi:chaperonin GroES|nr:chaperonin GroES [Actinomycetota bacterium]
MLPGKSGRRLPAVPLRRRHRATASAVVSRRFANLTASLRRMADDHEKHSIRMVADRLLVVESKEAGERKSRAGILIPATADVSRRLVWAEVAAVGPTVRTVEAGDTVLFSPDTGFEVEIQGEDYLILRERDVHAVASPRSEGGTGLYL